MSHCCIYSPVWTVKVIIPHYLLSCCVSAVIQQLNPCQLLTMTCCVCEAQCCVRGHVHMHVQQLSAACTSSSQWPKHSSRLLPKLRAALFKSDSVLVQQCTTQTSHSGLKYLWICCGLDWLSAEHHFITVYYLFVVKDIEEETLLKLWRKMSKYLREKIHKRK